MLSANHLFFTRYLCSYNRKKIAVAIYCTAVLRMEVMIRSWKGGKEGVGGAGLTVLMTL